MTTSQPVHPELREVGRRPFGVYAIIFLFVLFGAVAAFDIVRLRFGLPTTLLGQIAEFIPESSSLSGLPRLFFRDADVLVAFNFAIIFVTVLTAVGLWFRQRQAWVSAMVLIGVGLVYNIWNYLAGTPLYLSMLLHVFSVFYLNERSVQLSFERRQAAGAASRAILTCRANTSGLSASPRVSYSSRAPSLRTGARPLAGWPGCAGSNVSQRVSTGDSCSLNQVMPSCTRSSASV